MSSHQNRLAREASPYLLQHANNPVDWYPWGPEALARAKREDKPILLSIGYAACHWCHVMERESFEDAEISRLMNELYVNVKVDREERPDLDHIYQTVVQLMGRSGGWPLTVFLTPEQRPFFAGTYFPPVDRHGMPGFPKVLLALADAYKAQRGDVEEQAQEITQAIARATRVPSPDGTDLGDDLLRRASRKLIARFDDRHGGFGARPKFPNTMGLDVLLRRGALEGDRVCAESAALALDRMRAGGIWDHLRGDDLLRRASRKLIARFDDRHGGFGARPKFPNTMGLDVLLRRGALEGDRVCAESAALALDRMRAGGIWDHLRGGFHRYSTDEKWLVPHFEKMLYDNALLLRLYVDGWRAFGEAEHAETARELVGYLFAEMLDEGGAFYASQDADSEGHEGKFFVWTLSDLRAALGDDQRGYDVARLHYGITEAGNFEESGATVLSTARPLDRVAISLELSEAEAREALAKTRPAMLAYRERRPRPMRDDKVLASWNGLLIGALADAGRALGEPAWIEAAARAFASIEAGLVRGGRVGRYLKDGKAASDRPGFLDDHAYLGNAALDLYEATGEPRYEAAARAIATAMIDHHWDKAEGGFYFAPDDGEALISRTKDPFDQAVPSGASMAALLCLRLGGLSDASFTEPGERQLRLVGHTAVENPLGLGQTVLALDRLVRGSTDVVVVGARDAEDTKALVDAAFRAYLPNRTVAVVDPREPATVAAAAILAEGKQGGEGAVAYVCKGRACSAPVSDPTELARLLRG